MNQYFTKRTVIISAAAVVVLLAVIIAAVVMQVNSRLPEITLEYGTLDDKETELVCQSIPMELKGGNKQERVLAEIAKKDGYFSAMQEQSCNTMQSGREIEVSFDNPPEHLTLYVYDQTGNLLQNESLDETYRLYLSDGMDAKVYILEGIWENGICAYGFRTMGI